MLYHFSMIPHSLYQRYTLERNCRFQWIWFYNEGMKELPDAECQDLFIRGLAMTDYDIYNLRRIRKSPPEELSTKVKSMYGKAMVNGTAKIYKRYKDKEKILGDIGRWRSKDAFT